MEKLCTVEIESFRPIGREKVGLVVGSLKEAAKAHVAADMTTKVASLSWDMTCRMVQGD